MPGPFKSEPPAPQQANPYLPTGPLEPLLLEQFDGINTSTTRAGVDPKQMWWCDGFMPIGPRYLRTHWGTGPAIHREQGIGVVFFDFANIGATAYMIVIHTDGSMHLVNTATQGGQELAPAGTILTPNRANVGISQWGSQYILIVAQQTNGYFIYDGTNFYRAGGIGPVVTITNNGSGYTSAPSVAVTGGSGSGIVLTANVANGLVLSLTVVDPGSGYLPADTLTVAFSGGGGSGAAATVELMPVGVQGTAIETYSGRVWIVNGPTVTFSAPGSVFDFSSANGGGNFTSSDSFLRVGYTQLKQTNGFLYLLGDSSINYISGVTTTGSPPITTFTNQNADPEVGTPWPATVDVFGRNLVFANSFGAHVSYGAAVTKISEALDGIWNTVSSFGGFSPSAAKAIVFGKKLWMVLLPIIDPFTGQQVNKLLIWNGKLWWASGQDVALLYIQHQEINSVLTAYGTDGEAIYPLFQQPSAGFTKVVQSRLFFEPLGYHVVKAIGRFWMVANYYDVGSIEIDVRIDSNIDGVFEQVPVSPPLIEWTNNVGAAVVWKNNANVTVAWFASGVAQSQPLAISQWGAMNAMTLKSTATDMAIVSAMMQPQIVEYAG